MKLEFSRQVFEKKKVQISSFIKIRSVTAELFRTDGRINVTKLTVAFRNFAKSPKNVHDTDRHYWVQLLSCNVCLVFQHPSRLALGPTQPPIRWVSYHCPGDKAAEAWR